MGMYKYVRELWKQPKANLSELWTKRLIKWRKEPVTVRVDKPTRIDRARSLGYRAKQGIFVVRQKVKRGGHTRPKIRKGRRPKAQRQRLSLRKNYQMIAEERANKKYANCEVLNSYYVAEDGFHKWYEVIMVDRAHPSVLADDRLNWVGCKQHRGRVHRGLTSAGRKVRGLRGRKGKGAEKARPSRRANKRRY